MDKIPEKFPSIYNSPHLNNINIKLHNQTPYREIERWLKEKSECEDDCISASTIGRYNRYVLEHGGFEQLLSPEDITKEDITFTQLNQRAINLMYKKLPDLEGGNFVQACATIFKSTIPTNINLNADVNSDIGIITNETEEERLKRYEHYFKRINRKARSKDSNNNS